LDNSIIIPGSEGSQEIAPIDLNQTSLIELNSTTFREMPIVPLDNKTGLSGLEGSQEIASQEGISEEDRDLAWMQEEDMNKTKKLSFCFDVPSVPKNISEVVCSSRASTLIPLPRAWLLLNNLNPDAADACKTWKPAVGFKSVECINV